MKTRTARIKLGLGALALGVCVAAQAAAPVEVNVLNGQYTTYVFVQTNDVNVTTSANGDFQVWSPGNSRTTVSPVPFSDSLYSSGSGTLAAEANAGLFGISAFTEMGNIADSPAHNSTAGAESEIWFSPLTSGTATIGLELHGAYQWFYHAGSASLFDVTSNQTLWNYGWNWGSFVAGATWIHNGDGTVSAASSLETDFNAAHTYKLTMNEQTFADEDVEQTSIQLSGLVAVPEPSTFALVSLGAAAGLVLLCRRAFSAQRGSF